MIIYVCVCVYMYTSFHFVAFIFDVTHSGPRSRKLTTDSGEVASSTKGMVASVSAGLHELYRSEQVPSGKLRGRNGISPFSIGKNHLHSGSTLPECMPQGRTSRPIPIHSRTPTWHPPIQHKLWKPKLLLTQASSAICRHAANALQPQCPTNCG